MNIDLQRYNKYKKIYKQEPLTKKEIEWLEVLKKNYPDIKPFFRKIEIWDSHINIEGERYNGDKKIYYKYPFLKKEDNWILCNREVNYGWVSYRQRYKIITDCYQFDGFEDAKKFIEKIEILSKSI